MRMGELLAAAVLTAWLAVPAQGQDGGLFARHSFPEAGGTLFVQVAGLAPDGSVVIQLDRPSEAPPSLFSALVTLFDAPVTTPDGEGMATWVGRADPLGLLSFGVALDDADDVGRMIGMRVEDASDGRSAEFRLLVQPPMLLLPAASGIVRIDLRDGSVLSPDLPGAGGLSDAALSADGLLGYVLRDDGRLEEWPASRWGSAPLAVTRFDPSSDDLARERDSGPRFVLVTPDGEPFAPAGRLLFVDDAAEPLQLSPMGQAVSGRRWAVTPDGQTAFVAEDDLIVREIDLVTGRDRRPMPVGAPGDHGVVDVLVHAGQLLVATRRLDGRAGTLTVFDLSSGQLRTELLASDPERLVPLDDDSVLVLPRSGTTLERLVRGVPEAVSTLDGELLDVAAVPGGALLLVARAETRDVLRWDALLGASLLVADVPGASRMVTGGHALAVLIGDDGSLQRLIVDEARVEPLPGVNALPGTSFAIVP
ncbi:MAG: hypothetical protein H6825_05400 [Planctomycetes bacterium]|nr:hypothetical protein [Planctomycetota bacterium]